MSEISMQCKDIIFRGGVHNGDTAKECTTTGRNTQDQPIWSTVHTEFPDKSFYQTGYEGGDRNTVTPETQIYCDKNKKCETQFFPNVAQITTKN